MHTASGGDLPVTTTKPEAPSDDKRWRIVDTRMRRLGERPEALIEVLHSVQEAFGYLDTDAAVRREFGIKPGETTADDKLSLLTARCLGSCSVAPAMILDGEVHGKLSPDGVVGRLEAL